MTQPAGPSYQGQPAASLPGWLGPIVTITTQVGVPTVVAGVLLYFVLFRVDGAMRVIQDNEEVRTRMVAAMQDSLVAALDRQNDRFDKAVERNIEVNRTLADRIVRAYDKKDPAP